ncbi:MAG TPA: hypothetical protein VMZ06_14040 [Candidatus Bathyarchaeia archaeon]|nr:hypothetical protein [Candidatus Bathyarchaeia archaeon]
MRKTSLTLLLLVLCVSAWAQAPALPPGLAETPPTESAPSLPPGLEAAPESPPRAAAPVEPAPSPGLAERLRLNGFIDVRAGVRTQEDGAQPEDAPLGEARLQLRSERAWERAGIDAIADFYADAISEKGEFDLRRLRLTWRPADWIDVSAGRQVLTWGTGDMLFINDLFPKDWVSFFIGRDVEYLKAPSDAVRVGLFHDIANVDIVYTPQFEPDRYITGERISYWNPLFGRHAGRHDDVDANPPSDWFTDDELAVRIYRTFGSWEAALYGYWGYWKSPGGQRMFPMQATFPRLNVYGASLRGTVGRGVANAEFGWYESVTDRGGRSPFINNSELRLLLGYEQELAHELVGGVQYYVEHMLDYDEYRKSPFFLIMEPRDETRHVITLRLTKLLMNQNMTVSFFTYWSPSDSDLYARPHISYKITDNWRVEAGANIFAGRHDYTFFGQFEDNTNVYAGVRYSF